VPPARTTSRKRSVGVKATVAKTPTASPPPATWLIVGAGLSGAGLWLPASREARLGAQLAVSRYAGRVIISTASGLRLGRIRPLPGNNQHLSALRLDWRHEVPRSYRLACQLPEPGKTVWIDFPNIPPALMKRYLRSARR
jgi:hypothetical protein